MASSIPISIAFRHKFAPECDALLEIERSLGKPLPKLKEFKKSKRLGYLDGFGEQFGYAAKDGYVTVLNLSGQGLSSLPEGIRNLKSLRRLDISNNNLAYLPETMEKWIKVLKRHKCKVFL